MIRWLVQASALLGVATAAVAEPIPANLEFRGTITKSAPDTLTINGQPWTGPLPDYPYKVGDPITIAMTATAGTGVASADGFYRYTIVGSGQVGGIAGGNYAVAPTPDVSGPIAGGGYVNGNQVGGATPVPEPGAFGLMLLALVPLALRRRRGAIARPA